MFILNDSWSFSLNKKKDNLLDLLFFNYFSKWLIIWSSLRSKLKKAMAPHSSTLAWKIPWTEEPGRLQSMGSWRVRHDWVTNFTFHFSHSRIGEGNGNPLQCSLSVSYHFAFSYCSWGSQGKNTEVVCHFLLQWTTFCQNYPPWPIHLGWPYTAWLIVPLN